MHDPHQTWQVIEEIHVVFAPLPPPIFADLISTFTASSYWKFVGKMPILRESAYNLVLCPPKATKLKTYRFPTDAYKCWEFRNNCANKSPMTGKYVGKISLISAQRNVKFGTCIGATCCRCRAKNPLSKHWVNAILTCYPAAGLLVLDCCKYVLPFFWKCCVWLWCSGVLMWEVFTCGEMPYGKTKNADVINNICFHNDRLPQPQRCPDPIFELMHSCWLAVRFFPFNNI